MRINPAEGPNRWLAQAEADLRYAETAYNARHYALVCFLSQQAAEKALKGALRWLVGDAARTHLIGDLLDELRKSDAVLAEQLNSTRALDAYYQSTRYPDALDGAVPDLVYQAEEAQMALNRATSAVRALRAIVPTLG